MVVVVPRLALCALCARQPRQLCTLLESFSQAKCQGPSLDDNAPSTSHADVRSGHSWGRRAHSVRGLSSVIRYDSETQDALVKLLAKRGLLTSQRLQDVFREVDRREFAAAHMGVPDHVAYAVS